MTPIWKYADPANYAQGRRGQSVDKIVVHWTVGSLNSTVAQFQSPLSGVSAHYIIDRDGLLYQCVSETDTAYHAGDFNVNLRSIGIEHVGGPQYDGFTDEQYAMSADLCQEIAERHSFTVDALHVQGHREFVATQCPGVLDIERIIGGNMTDAQMAELKAFIDAKVQVIVAAAVDVERRSMRGGDPGAGFGNEPVIAAGEKIFQTDAKG